MTKEALAELLNRFPEVKWDRMTATEQEGETLYWVFGWVARPDPYSDFAVLNTWLDDAVSLSTSSARYSQEFQDRLFGEGTDHNPCQRVEDVLGSLVPNRVILGS
jgi:hypothetical protein